MEVEKQMIYMGNIPESKELGICVLLSKELKILKENLKHEEKKVEIEGNILKIKGEIDVNKGKLDLQRLNDSNKHTEEMNAMELPFKWQYIPLDYPQPESFM